MRKTIVDIRCQLLLRILSLVLVTATISLHAEESHPLHPDSQPQTGVPEGRVESYQFASSSVFPGTERDYFVYVPVQYDAAKPAALMVFQDGGGYINRKGNWRVPVVFDNLIHKGEMPVTIAVMVNPGIVPGGAEAQSRFNRSYEYDSVSDRYATFLIDELLPVVKQKYNISDDPNLRGIGGSSSGAIAAFGVAWHRPDQFRRVFSTVGTYVGLRGGNEYPTLVRKTEPKPLRVFLQDGRNDLDIYGGSWWNANQTMLSALQWAGYQVKNDWGDGGHNGKHGAAIMPDAMRWLWQDFDKPIEVTIDEHPELKDRLIPGETWELVSEGHRYTEGPAVAPDGSVYFIDGPAGEIWKVNADGKGASKFIDGISGVSGLMFDAKGNLYAARNKERKISRIAPDGAQTVIASDVGCNDLVVLEDGIYFTDPLKPAVWYLPHGGEPTVVASGDNVDARSFPGKPNGIAVTPDKRFLVVVDATGRYIWSYRIEQPGKLSFGQPYYYVHQPQDELNTGADGVTMAKDGSLLVATSLGVQVFDQPGRVHVIIDRPSSQGRLSNCVFGGPEGTTLYVTCGTRVFRRNTRIEGFAPWQESVVPAKPRL